MSASPDSPPDATMPPPAEGVRLDWSALPSDIRAAVGAQLGSPVIAAESQRSGFSPGVAARLLTADGQRAFVKAVSPTPNPDSPAMHRQEQQIVAALPGSAPVPRLLWSYDEGEAGWIVLLFEDVEGAQPAQPWRTDELDRVLAALEALGAALTPSPLPHSVVSSLSAEVDSFLCGWRTLHGGDTSAHAPLDPWSVRHLDRLAALEALTAAAVRGETLLHCDLRADNILLTPDQVWFVDWPHAKVGALWVDAVFFAPSVTMQGGPPPEAILARHSAYQKADPDAVTAVIVGLAGFFTERSLLPPPPGLPTLRAFQAAQAAVARRWIAERTGWR